MKTTWDVIHFTTVSAEQLKDRQFMDTCARAYKAMKPKRAEAIEAAISVEGILDLVLLNLLVGRDQSRGERFSRR